jgi:Ni,Fe-hydrogenase I cytochrome b subunit
MLLLAILGYYRLFHLKITFVYCRLFHLRSFLAILNNFVTTLILGLRLKQRFAKVQTESEVWKSHFMFLSSESVGGCERINPHIPKWAPTLGVGVLVDF